MSDESTIVATNEPPAPVAEARKYRKRAQAAEQELAALKQTLAEREHLLASHQHKLAALKRRQQLDELLTAAGALDLDAARALIEQTLEGQADAPDLDSLVNNLAHSKPLLFQQKQSPSTAAAMAARTQRSPRERLGETGLNAAATGNRNDILRYMRERRAYRGK